MGGQFGMMNQSRPYRVSESTNEGATEENGGWYMHMRTDDEIDKELLCTEIFDIKCYYNYLVKTGEVVDITLGEWMDLELMQASMRGLNYKESLDK